MTLDGFEGKIFDEMQNLSIFKLVGNITMDREFNQRNLRLFNALMQKQTAQIGGRAKEARWDKIYHRHINRNMIAEQYNGWLEKEKITDVLSKNTKPILDLGSGIGIDTLHLIEKGYQVLACDFSDVALSKVRENISQAKIRKVNMEEPLPFSDREFDFILANKSIHYFSAKKTQALIDEIYRILDADGHLAFIVNSTKDENFGAGQGIRLEDNFYEVRGTTKRFFDEKSLDLFFDKRKWEFIYKFEGDEESSRTGAVSLSGTADRKMAWTCLVKKKEV